MTNKNTKSKKMTFVLLALVLVTSLFIGGTIARYVTSTNSEDDARVAVWGINEAGPTTMDLFSNEYKLEDDTIVAKSKNGDNLIAPGLNGVSQFKIIEAKKAGLAPEVMYEVNISLNDSEIADEIKNHPGIEWRVDDGEWGTWEEFKTSLLSLSGDASGVKTYAPGVIAPEFANGKVHTVAWQWIMDSGYDEEDTAMGNLAVDGDINANLSITITAKQTDIDSTGMLEGNGSVYNTNDPQVLTFRADADYETFDNLEIDGSIVPSSNYDKEPGSIIIKLKKAYLATLATGSHKISINTTDGKSIESRFTVKTDGVIAHNGIIPEGGTYYVGVRKNQYDYYDHQDYSTASAVYTEGDAFPTPQQGDVYIYGDYEYRYRVCFQGATSVDVSSQDTETEWCVRVLDSQKTTYGPIISFIGNKKVNNLAYAFHSCDKMTVAPELPKHTFDISNTFNGTEELTTPPIIPESVKYMQTTFQFSGITTAPKIPAGVTSLYGTFWYSKIHTAPVIPSNVEYMEMAFMQCENLSGTITINAENIKDIDMGIFIGVTNPIVLTGTNSQLEEMAEIYTEYGVDISVAQ